MIANPREIWVYLAASPLLHLTLTLAAYLVGDYLFRKSGQKAIVNPVLIAILILVAILPITGTSYETYFEGAQFVHFLLGPATVALAGPLYRQFDRGRPPGPAIPLCRRGPRPGGGLSPGPPGAPIPPAEQPRPAAPIS